MHYVCLKFIDKLLEQQFVCMLCFHRVDSEKPKHINEMKVILIIIMPAHDDCLTI